jgi:hypothetical protein
MVAVRSALGRIGDLRREFVDPHVLRIWEKAVEKSGHSATPSITVTQSESSFAEASPATDPPVDLEVPAETPSVDTATLTPIGTFEKAASVAEKSAAHASKVIDELEREIHATEAAQEVVTPTPQPEMTLEPTPSEHSEVEQNLPSETPAIDRVTESHPPPAVEDLDDFLKDIGFDEEEKAPEPEPEPIPEVTPQVDKEAKKAATALKRAKIVSRHARWQSQLDELAEDMEIRVKNELLAIREDAVAAIGDGKGQEAIEKVQNEGEKLLKGLEAYVKKLMAREIKPEKQEKEQESYERVIDKVEAKFRDAVSNVQEDVHNWYMSVRDKEAGVVGVISSIFCV